MLVFSNIPMSEIENTDLLDETSHNIFDDFVVDEATKKEVESREKDSEKDFFYYISKGNIVFYIGNILLLLIVSLSVIYIQIQAREWESIPAFLEPICPVFVGNIDPLPGSSCTSVTASIASYQTKLKDLKTEFTKTITPLLLESYGIDNFLASKKVSFLLMKNEARLQALEMLEHFDTLHANYVPVDKLEIQCSNIVLENINRFSVDCDVYSSDWDESIAVLEDGILRRSEQWGSSISKASAFIDYLERSPESRFKVIEKPSVFSYEEVQFWPYTKKTSFRLVLDYSTNTSLLY